MCPVVASLESEWNQFQRTWLRAGTMPASGVGNAATDRDGATCETKHRNGVCGFFICGERGELTKYLLIKKKHVRKCKSRKGKRDEQRSEW